MKLLINMLCLSLLVVLANCGTDMNADIGGNYEYAMKNGQLVPAAQGLRGLDQSDPGLTFSSENGKLQMSGEDGSETEHAIDSDGTANSCSGTVNCSRRSCSCRGDRSCCISSCVYLICRLCGC